MQLHEIQTRMSHALFSNQPLAHEANLLFKSTSTLKATQRLQIYNVSYWCRLIDAFYEDFPGLQAVLGPRLFNRMTKAYLSDRPSHSFTLRNLGRYLESWMQDQHALFGPKHEIALDMARLEWADVEAFDNAELPPLTVQAIANAGADLRVTLQPHLRVLKLRYPVDDIKLAAPKRPSKLPKTAGIYLAVHRSDLSVYYKRLDAEEYGILSSLRDGATLECAIEQGFEGTSLSPDDQVEKLGAWFGTWASLGWLAGGPNDDRS